MNSPLNSAMNEGDFFIEELKIKKGTGLVPITIRYYNASYYPNATLLNSVTCKSPALFK